MTIGRAKMESCFILVFEHKGTGEILAQTSRNEEQLCLEVERMELMGHSILYVLSVFNDEVRRYW